MRRRRDEQGRVGVGQQWVGWWAEAASGGRGWWGWGWGSGRPEVRVRGCRVGAGGRAVG
jgi:hypothetical protein